MSSYHKGLKIRFMDIGDRDSKKVTLLLYGKKFAGFFWERMVRELQVKVHRVIIPDQIGFWKSTKPGYYDYLFSQLTLNTKNLLDHLNFSSKIHVVGHSMGGGPATHLASRYPEKFNKLILVNPVGLERYQDYVQTEAPQFFYENLELKKIPEKVRNYQKIVLL